MKTILLLLCCLVITINSQAQAALVKKTQIKIFSPMAIDSERDVIRVTKRYDGDCKAHSLADPDRPDAWRCAVGNTIYDPCFRNSFGSGNSVVCIESPWSKTAILVNSNIPLGGIEPALNIHKAMPWALVLHNGLRCTLLTGATATIAGMRINYSCGDNDTILGSVDRTGQPWWVFYRSGNSISLKQINVRTVWY